LSFRQRGAVHKKQTPFLEVPRRLAVRAVKGAVFAFTGAERKPFTEEADGLGAGFGRKGGSGRTRKQNNHVRRNSESASVNQRITLS